MDSASPQHRLLPDVYSVSRLNRTARDLLERGMAMLWVEGELSNLAQPGSGHWYFCLKDAQAQVRCALFRSQQRLLSLKPRDGMHVLVRARVSLYEGRGEFQLIVEHMEESGEGALKRAFEALKQRLNDEGLFEQARKRPLPTLPRRVGIVTSPTGAAIRDIVTTFKRRFPAIALLVYPVPVQGEGAPAKIAAALRLASARAECDAIILARGGGSLEDLWAFNDEQVARAIAACRVPVVSGIGHEVDVTIADFVADMRAPTPTAAAELLSPDRTEWAAQFDRLQQRFRTLAQRRLQDAQQALDRLTVRLRDPRRLLAQQSVLLSQLRARLRTHAATALTARKARLAQLQYRLQQAAPTARVARLSARMDAQYTRLQQAMHNRLRQTEHRLALHAQRLDAMSPLQTLRRGYAIVQTDDRVVRDAGTLRAGDKITIRFAAGAAGARIEDIDK